MDPVAGRCARTATDTARTGRGARVRAGARDQARAGRPPSPARWWAAARRARTRGLARPWSHQQRVADQADRHALEFEIDIAERHHDGLEVRVLRDQLDRAARAAKALDGDVVAQPRDDDLAVLGLARLLHREQVAIE